jgi:adenylate cyclase
MNWKAVGNRFSLVIAIAITCIGVSWVCAVLWNSGKLQPLELKSCDLMMKLHLQPEELSAANDIVVIGIDEQDLDALQHYPLNDGDKLALFRKLNDWDARAIGVDLYMNITVGDNKKDTADLHAYITQNRASRNIITPCYVAPGTVLRPAIPPLPEWKAPNRLYGFTDQPYDNDFKCRVALLYLDAGGFGLQALSLGVANQYLERSGVLNKAVAADPVHYFGYWSKTMREFKQGDGGYAQVRSPGGFTYFIDYRGPKYFTTYSLRQVIPERFDPKRIEETLQADGKKPITRAEVAGKVVMVGMMAISVKDYIETPIHGEMERFGVQQHASLVDQLIRTARDHSVPMSLSPTRRTLGYAWGWGFLGALTGLTGRFGFSRRAPVRLLFFAAVGLFFIVLITALAFHHRMWLPLVPASFCWLVSIAAIGTYVTHLEFADRKTLNHIFVRLVQKEVATELWKRRGELLEDGKLRSRKLTATMMFTDVAGFTSACEKLDDPNKVIEWINAYHARMTAIVAANDGVVVRYMGDGMMAVFGAPHYKEKQNHALDAVRAGVRMREALKDLLPEWEKSGLEDLAVRVGINSGEVVEGSIGSSSRFEYTILGDNTNVAARLEQHDKNDMGEEIAPGRCRILITQSTFDSVRDKIRCMDRGKIVVRNKKDPIPVYAVLGLVGATV